LAVLRFSSGTGFLKPTPRWFIFAEFLSIGLAVLFGFFGYIAKSSIEDVEREDQDEEAEKHQRSLEEKMNKPHPGQF